TRQWWRASSASPRSSASRERRAACARASASASTGGRAPSRRPGETSHRVLESSHRGRPPSPRARIQSGRGGVNWSEIPGWFQWRSAQEEAARSFPAGSRFLEVGNYLGRSLCSLAEVVERSGKSFTVIGVDTCRGSGVEGPRARDYHGGAAAAGGGTFAGTLHQN